MPALWNFPKADFEPYSYDKKHTTFSFPIYGARFKYLPEGCPYMLMYSALHIMQWFSHILDVFTPVALQARGGGQGAECPPETSDREISANLPGKNRQAKKGKRVKIEKKRRKIAKGKLENWKWKVEKLQNEERTWNSDENFSILTFLWIKTNLAYTRLGVIAKQRSALQVEFITGVKLICYNYTFLHKLCNFSYTAVGRFICFTVLCIFLNSGLTVYFVLHYCFLHWAHPPYTAVGDLDFHYIYLWSRQK